VKVHDGQRHSSIASCILCFQCAKFGRSMSCLTSGESVVSIGTP
jgi:hypothetical protein